MTFNSIEVTPVSLSKVIEIRMTVKINITPQDTSLLTWKSLSKFCLHFLCSKCQQPPSTSLSENV